MGNGIGGFGAATFRLAVSGSLDVEPCTELSGRRGINAARGMSDKEKIFDPLRHRAQRLYGGRLSTQKVKALTA